MKVPCPFRKVGALGKSELASPGAGWWDSGRQTSRTASTPATPCVNELNGFLENNLISPNQPFLTAKC